MNSQSRKPGSEFASRSGFIASKPLLCWLLFAFAGDALADFREFQAIPVNDSLGQALARTADAARKEFPQLTPENLALSVIDLTDANAPVRADYNGDAQFYPASVIKLFFMAAVFQQGRHTPEIDRALREMIVVSDNDATAYLVDVLTDTTAGRELEGKALEDFIDRRRAINRSFASTGYDISAMAKPWSFGPFGREMQLLGPNRENRNRCSANSVASLLYWIVSGSVSPGARPHRNPSPRGEEDTGRGRLGNQGGRASRSAPGEGPGVREGAKRSISPEGRESMLKLLERPLDPPRPDENQVKDFFGESLPPGSKLWSKSGETSEVRHDAAYVELPNGRKLIIVIFTRIGDVKPLLPAIGRHVLQALSP